MISPTSVRGFTGYYVFKCLYSGYRHAVMTKDKSSASFEETLSYVIDFYNLLGHLVKKIRFDVGSTDNSLSSATFLSNNRIDVDPAAVKSQFQNPVEREVQTINKGVAALLIDQSTLGPSFWCYAVESWIRTPVPSPFPTRSPTNPLTLSSTPAATFPLGSPTLAPAPLPSYAPTFAPSSELSLLPGG